MVLNFSGICNLFYLCPFIDFKFFFKSHLILTYSSGKDGVYPWVQQDKGLNKVDLINDILHMSFLAGTQVFKVFPAYTTTEL